MSISLLFPFFRMWPLCKFMNIADNGIFRGGLLKVKCYASYFRYLSHIILWTIIWDRLCYTHFIGVIEGWSWDIMCPSSYSLCIVKICLSMGCMNPRPKLIILYMNGLIVHVLTHVIHQVIPYSCFQASPFAVIHFLDFCPFYSNLLIRMSINHYTSFVLVGFYNLAEKILIIKI